MKQIALMALALTSALANADVTGEVKLSSGRDAANCVVFLEGAEHAKPLANAMVDQKDRKFIPHVTVVTVGTKVAFPNHDTIFHNVFSEYHNTKFDFGMYARGKTKYQTFDRPGVAVLLCSVHPDMGAYVVVVDTPYYAKADESGRFTIPGVKPGRYTVNVWHESGETYKMQAEVGPDSHLQLKTKR